MNRYHFPILVLLAACSPQAPRTAAPDSLELAQAAATITAADVRSHVAFLASDELGGRDTPSEGLETAARWIADQWATYGLEPAGTEGWLQRYPYPAQQIDRHSAELGVVAGGTHLFEYGREFYAHPGGPVSRAVEAVYVGPVVPTDVDLADRAAVVRLDAVPGETRRGFGFPWGARRQIAAATDHARERGAAAVVFVLAPEIGEDAVARLAEAADEPSRTLGGNGDSASIPTFYVIRSAAARLFRAADAPGLMDRDSVAAPVPLRGVRLRLAAPTRVVDDARPPNVVGLLRGSDPELRESYVVLTAHFDHMGIGTPDETGDSIYNGADDDASGTSVLVEVAGAMARLDPRPARSLLFLGVSGEEKGLLGSYWFSEHPTVPLESIVANINLDMVGRNAPDSIVVIGQEYSTLGATLEEVAGRHPDLGLTVSEDLWPEQRFFFRSDHYNFARKEIPALFFFAGVHEDYHRPGDEVDELDADKTARVGRLVFYLAHAVASDRRSPRWHDAGLETVRQLTGR